MNETALYDALNCAAQAIDEAGSGRPSAAMTAWLAAETATDRAFAPGDEESNALWVIIGAASPSCAGEPWRADLWRALGATALACLIAEEGDTECADKALMDAADLAVRLPCRESLATILAAIWDLSRSGVAA